MNTDRLVKFIKYIRGICFFSMAGTLMLSGCSSEGLAVLANGRMQLNESWLVVPLVKRLKVTDPANDVCLLLEKSHLIQYQENRLEVSYLGEIAIEARATTATGNTVRLNGYSSLERDGDSYVCLSFNQNFGDEQTIHKIELRSMPAIYVRKIVWYSRI